MWPAILFYRMKTLKYFSIPILATIFNLFFEYSLRGLNGFISNPSLIIFLISVYLPWFIMLEDVIRRFRLNDKQVLILPFASIATLYGAFFIPSQAFYAPPLFLGINWGQLVWIGLFWWSLLQTIMTQYFALRISPRKSIEPLLSKKGWIITLSVWIFAGLLFKIQIVKSGLIVLPITLVSATVIAVIAMLLIKKLHSSYFQTAQKSRVMDILTVLTIFVFSFCAVRFNQAGLSDYHPINTDALTLVIIWTTISGLIMLAHRVVTKKPFMV